jgi:hypothetical protein
MSPDSMRRARNVLALLACAVAGVVVVPGCAGGNGTTYVGYSYGGYYGDPWGYDYYYAGGPIYVGPPDTKPPPQGRPPQASQLPARPMPAPRPTSGGGRRR